MKDRVLALAGLLQAVQQVQRMANQGQSESRPLSACIESLFRFDAEDAEAVFGSSRQLEYGLKRLLDQIEGGPGRDAAQTRMGLSILHLERRFIANEAATSAVHEGLLALKEKNQQLGPLHPEVLTALGELYAAQISPIGPRVLVQGNPVYLAQPQVVGEIRACLLAALRAAVLWRQCGGSYWDLFLSRQVMAETARSLLAS